MSWDNIWNEFKKSDEYKNCYAATVFTTYMKWLRKNYDPPVSKKEKEKQDALASKSHYWR
jgi:hypothetical protein